MLDDSLSTPLLDSQDSEAQEKIFQDTIQNHKDDNQQRSHEEDLESWEPKPPKVLMENPHVVPLELRSQIQMYATTEYALYYLFPFVLLILRRQLTHPLVSPVLQGSLGNLPPLYIIAGDGEVLRDEIIYLAHKAAHPKDYPARTGVLRSRRQKENAEKFTEPTRVGQSCSVFTLFLFFCC